MTLDILGWRASFASAFNALSDPSLQPARIARQDKNRYRIYTSEGLHPALLTGTLLKTGPWPAVGDWVAVETRPGGEPAVIRAVLPRFSVFSRKKAGDTTQEQVVAANVDTLFLVSGLDGDFNIRRIERYVTQAWNSGATPVILLNKADRHPYPEAARAEVEATIFGVDVHVLSAADGTGIEALEPYLKTGQTVALLGSSGVGKSTLVNRLLGREVMKTAAVREDDSRGRHTTTHRELFLRPEGGLILDTPGMRELQMWGDEEDLTGAFGDIEDLAVDCRFSDCTHENEPGCAVCEALEDGHLNPAHYQSYLKLRRELAYLQRRQQETDHEERRRGKKFGKIMKDMKRNDPKRRYR